MLRAVFFGTPDIALSALEKLFLHPEIEIICVVSQPDRPAGRGQQLKSPEVADFAKKNGIRIHQTDNINCDQQFLDELVTLNADFFLVFAFAQFLSSKILNLPKLGCFNIHTSLLPRHRGAAPIHYTILMGDKVGGVSIQRMVKKMDAGDLCLSLPLEIDERETTVSLYQKLKDLSAVAVDRFINLLLTGQLTFVAQDEDAVTFAPTIKKEEGFINPLLQSACDIDRRIRAFTPWPGVHILLGNKRTKILSAKVTSQVVRPGEVLILRPSLFLGCQQGSLEILELQIEGKKAQSANDWINGLRGEIPSIQSLLENSK
jgi:methionyl-tRNA formyltransferase